MRRADPGRLEDALGYQFANKDLLVRALTHASALGNAAEAGRTYQRLEFLGDRVLGLIVADLLIERFPDAPEGELSRWFHRLVSGKTCAQVAREMELEKYIRFTGARPSQSVLGDACESVLGALYRDGGLAAARRMVERHWTPRIEAMQEPPRDAKTALQEWAHQRGGDAPNYVEIARSGPDHAPEFEIEVSLGIAAPERGQGRSKREAEQAAAAALLRREGVWEE